MTFWIHVESFRVKRRLAGIAILLGAALPAMAGEVIFRDDFNAPTLESGWSFVRENPEMHSLTDRVGYFRIDTERGALEEGGVARNFLLRDITGDFVLEVRLEFNPRAAREFGGILVYFDDANAVALGLTFVSGERGEFRGIALVGVADGDAVDERAVARFDDESAVNPNVVYLRLLRSGAQFVAGFSDDGTNFIELGSITAALPASVQVGLGAANGDFPECGADCDISIPADFDYFQISSFDGVPPGGSDLPALVELIIEGPDALEGGSMASFTATAVFDDDTEQDVTDDADWSLAPIGVGTIDGGVLAADPVAVTQQATIVASYTHSTTAVGETTLTATKVVQILAASGGPSMCGAGVATLMWMPLLSFAIVRRRRHGV